ncbi:hypothetical protein A2Z41_00340 [Microgenomates group bacterium RBG_19FT_COMBO_39_10]|nr:MAG: hypothetical protein A2Z41_00340 [Microgenomates group bacterium RBG_19FT_COMBO_39_10]
MRGDICIIARSSERVVMHRKDGKERLIHFTQEPGHTCLCQTLHDQGIPFRLNLTEHAIVLRGVRAIGSSIIELKSNLQLRLLGRKGWQIIQFV